MLNNLNKYNVKLASKSPRRRELLKELGINFDIARIIEVEEVYPDSLNTTDVAEFLANIKADAYIDTLEDNDLIITADTVVICENKVLGKPTDRNDALEMIHLLSGKSHNVVTGVTLLSKSKRCSFSVNTEVTFADISTEEATYYVDNFKPFDKAGAYGIQEWIGYAAVKGINGSFYNVMGLPLHRLYQELKQF